MLAGEPKAIHDEMGATFDEYGRMKAIAGCLDAEPDAHHRELHHAGLCRSADRDHQAVGLGRPDRQPDGWHADLEDHPQRRRHPSDPLPPVPRAADQPGRLGRGLQAAGTERSWAGRTPSGSVRSRTPTSHCGRSPHAETLPFKIPNSFRPMEPALPVGSTLGFTNIDPLGNPITPGITNEIVQLRLGVRVALPHPEP